MITHGHCGQSIIIQHICILEFHPSQWVVNSVRETAHICCTYHMMSVYDPSWKVLKFWFQAKNSNFPSRSFHCVSLTLHCLHPLHLPLQPAAPKLLSTYSLGPARPQRNTKHQAGGRNAQQRWLIENHSVSNSNLLHAVSSRLALELVVGEECD